MDREEPPGVSERRISVEWGQLKLFGKATGQADLRRSNPVDAADGPEAPLTFAYSLGALAFGTESWSEELGIDPTRLLHGEQTFEYFEPICAGDEILLRRKLVDRYEKKNGALQFVVVDTEAVNQRNELCVRSRMVGVIPNP